MVLKIIKDSDIGFPDGELNNPKTREASRGIVVKGNKVALLHKANKNEYKLPGGGLDAGEKPEEGFIREVMEETGCTVKDIKYLGTTEEHKTATNFKQISHIFIAKVKADTHTLHLTEKEITEGGELVWTDIDTAISLVENSFDQLVASQDESIYMTRFIIRRDTFILKYYKKLLQELGKEPISSK